MEDVNQRFQQADQAAQQAIAMSQSGANLESELRKAVTERFQNSNIASQQATARQDYLNAGTNARAEIADIVKSGSILNPSQQQAIQAAKQSTAAIPLETSSNLMSLLTGGLENAISGGVNAFTGMTKSAIDRAELLQTSAQDFFDRIMDQRAEARATKEFAINEQLARANLALKQQELARGPESELDKMIPINTAIENGIPIGTTYRDLYGETIDKQKTNMSDEIASLESLGSYGSRNIFGQSAANYGNIKNTLGQSLAKEFENGRLTDEDRAFYLNLLPPYWEWKINPDRALAKLRGTQYALKVSNGEVDSNSPILEDPNTKKRYQYDSISDETYKSRLKQGWLPSF